MKRNDTMVWIMLADSVAFPVIVGLAGLCGYTLRAGNGFVYAAAATALYVFCAVRLLRAGDKQISTAAMIALSVTLLLNQIQTLFFIMYVFDSGRSIPASLLLALWFWVTVAVVAVCVKSKALKAVFYTLSGLLVLPICLFLLLSGFGCVSKAAASVSPRRTYCAELIEYDEGALGGHLEVCVYKCKGSFVIGSFEFRRQEKEIYRGKWGNSRVLYWDDDEHLAYNNTTYDMQALYKTNK